MSLLLQPGAVPLSLLETVYRTGEPARLDPSCNAIIADGAARIAAIAAGSSPVYGINTGFGKLASIRIGAADVATLQRNLILSHCCGVGAPLAEDIVRLIMTLKLISLGRGASGVRPEIVRLIEAMLARGVIPVIPEKGSVGASGDLAPLAHLSAVMMGQGEAFVAGERLPGQVALEKASLAPLVFAAKEGLALINGTQVSTALALAGLFRAHRATQAALITGALSTDAAMGSPAPFRAEIHLLRGHRGQIDTAAALRRLLDGSPIRESHREGDTRVQDPYCIRCQSQVDGACLDVLRAVARTLEIEANAVTDNPLLLSDGSVVSCGNFHAEPVALAADQIALAVCEVGAIAQRRIALLVDPALSLRAAAISDAQSGVELRVDDRGGHLGRADVREQADVASGLRRLHADLRQPGRPRFDGVPRRAPVAGDDGEPFWHHRHRGADGGAGRGVARAADDQPDPAAGAGDDSRRRAHLGAGSLYGARPRGGDGVGRIRETERIDPAGHIAIARIGHTLARAVNLALTDIPDCMSVAPKSPNLSALSQLAIAGFALIVASIPLGLRCAYSAYSLGGKSTGEAVLAGFEVGAGVMLAGFGLLRAIKYLTERSVVMVLRGHSPVILSFPHVGTRLPPAIAARLNDNGRILADTDWWLRRLYGPDALGNLEEVPQGPNGRHLALLNPILPFATLVWANFHRYVIDANRDPRGVSLYPGQSTTDLVPLTDFDGQPIWREGQEPTATDIAARLKEFHAPYHAALTAEIARVKRRHGVAVVYDCHSIRSCIPHLFEGTLPDFNIGTDGGRTCAPEIEAAAVEVADAAAGYTSILNGRFRGGWTTRHYGRPAEGVHAIQMELAQSTYLKAEAPPFEYDQERAVRIRVHPASGPPADRSQRAPARIITST